MTDNRPVILDIGSNFGIFGWCARKLFPKATIIGFEPNATLAAYTIGLGCYNAVHRVALSDVSGIAKLRMTRELDGYTGNIGDSDTYDYKDEIIEVPSAPLDGYGYQPDLVKIDVDGSERLVLAGGYKTLRETPYVIMECMSRQRRAEVASVLGRPFKRLTLVDNLYTPRLEP